MKRMKKILILFTMLFTGLSFKGANAADKMVVADAADVVADEDKPEPGSYVFLNRFWKSTLTSKLSDKGFTDVSLIKTILFTNDEKKVPASGNLEGCPVDTGLDGIDKYTGRDYTPTNMTNGCIVAAYVSQNLTDTTMFDCIFYAKVETIYVADGSSLLSYMSNLEKITFDFNLSLCIEKSMGGMFYDDAKLEQIVGLDCIDTSKVTNMRQLFYNCESLKEVDVSNFKTSNVTNMSEMFTFCNNLATINGLTSETFDTASVTNMNNMFSNCPSLKTLDLSGFKTSNVTNMLNMFGSCKKLTAIKGLEKWDTSNVTNMYMMFSSCSSLTTLDLSNFDTSKVTNMSYMFSNCSGLTTLDLSKFNFSSVTDINHIEKYFLLFLSNLQEIKVPNNLNNTIDLPGSFGMRVIDPSMAGWTLLKGSKEFNTLYNTLMKINVCTEYMQAPELQAMYDGLSNEEKDKLATLSDDSGVILTDKLSYMVGYADFKANEVTATTSGTHLVLSAKTSQYLVLVIACLSLSLIGGYYFIQKKKYAK